MRGPDSGPSVSLGSMHPGSTPSVFPYSRSSIRREQWKLGPQAELWTLYPTSLLLSTGSPQHPSPRHPQCKWLVHSLPQALEGRAVPVTALCVTVDSLPTAPIQASSLSIPTLRRRSQQVLISTHGCIPKAGRVPAKAPLVCTQGQTGVAGPPEGPGACATEPRVRAWEPGTWRQLA